METSTLTIKDFERVMAALFQPVDTGWPQFVDSDFDTMSRLLIDVGKPQWSCRPRTYAVLRMIDGTDLFDAFTLEGLKDIAFPFTDSRLPSSLSPTAKAKFLKAQKVVLTKASDLEKTDGRHRHLDEDADTHYHVLKILGRGAFGEVHHIRSKLSLEEYARKRVHRRKAFSKDRAAITMFENELTNLKRLSHHHLVKFVGSYTDPKYIGLLMSPVADCDLKVFLERSPFPKDDLPLLQGFFGCLCSAVLYLHNNKCRHKDLKPGNILVYMNNVLITDFGTARDWSGQSRSTTTGRSGAYTPGYAAPEVVHEDPRNSSADIWSLGCVYVDMLTVLRGESLISKGQFFADNGTGGANPRSNTEALDLWLTRLDQETDSEPVRWITQMLKRTPSERITAAGLMEQIYSYEDCYVYYNSCCNEEESEDGTSYQGSILEGDATAIFRLTDSTNALVENNIADLPLSISRFGLDEESIQRQTLPSELLESENQGEPETMVHHQNNASRDATIDNATAKLLSENGFDINADSFRVQDAFIWAAKNGHKEIVQLLLENRPNIEAKDKDKNGKTALHWAAANGYEGVVQLLLHNGADAEARNTNGSTALHEACRNEHEATVQLLLEKGADVEAKGDRGGTALQLVAWKGNEVIARLLLKHNANVQVIDIGGRSPLHRASMRGHTAMVQLLLENGAIINIGERDLRAPLHLAAQYGHEAIVRLLLENGAHIENRNHERWTALHSAAAHGHETVVQQLLEKGAKIKAKTHLGWTALHLAALNGYMVLVQLLLEKGAGINEKDSRNWTALLCAASYGHESVVRLLIKKGADLKAKDNDGLTAAFWANKNGHEEISQLLKKVESRAIRRGLLPFLLLRQNSPLSK